MVDASNNNICCMEKRPRRKKDWSGSNCVFRLLIPYMPYLSFLFLPFFPIKEEWIWQSWGLYRLAFYKLFRRIQVALLLVCHIITFNINCSVNSTWYYVYFRQTVNRSSKCHVCLYSKGNIKNVTFLLVLSQESLANRAPSKTIWPVSPRVLSRDLRCNPLTTYLREGIIEI